MANAITLAKEYIAYLDKVYKLAAKTSVLDVAPQMVKAAANAGEFNVQKLALVGLGTYSKTDGPPSGDVTLTWETKTYAYDRGRKFNLDAVDEMEAMGAFGNVASEFLRTKVVPEIDAVRIARLAGTSGITSASADLADAAAWVAALNVAQNTLDDNEVPEENRALFITPTGLRLVQTAASTAAKTDVLDRAQVITMPHPRFHEEVALNSGASAAAGGFAGYGSHINFLLMDKGAAFADAKHTSIKYFSPQENQTSDAWVFHYRIFHDCFVYENKVKGIYVHKASAHAATPNTPNG